MRWHDCAGGRKKLRLWLRIKDDWHAAPPGRWLGNPYVIPWTWLVPVRMLTNHMWYCCAPRITSVLPPILETEETFCIVWPLHSTMIMLLWSSSWEAGWFPEVGIITKESYALLLRCRSLAYTSLCLGFSLFLSWGEGCFFSFKIQFSCKVFISLFWSVLLLCGWFFSVSLQELLRVVSYHLSLLMKLYWNFYQLRVLQFWSH